MADIRAFALNCTLTKSPAPSSTELLTDQILQELGDLGAQTSRVRVIDENVAAGVEKDMGAGDGWPRIREQILAADIVVVCAPIWMGHLSSVGQSVLERLDAELSETDDAGRPILFGKVAVTGIVGTKTARTRPPRTCTRACRTSVSPCPRRAEPTGSARRCTLSTTATWTRRPRPSRAQRRRSRATRCISLRCCEETPTPAG